MIANQRELVSMLEGRAAVQRDFSSLEKCYSRNFMKFNKGRGWRIMPCNRTGWGHLAGKLCNVPLQEESPAVYWAVLPRTWIKSFPFIQHLRPLTTVSSLGNPWTRTM